MPRPDTTLRLHNPRGIAVPRRSPNRKPHAKADSDNIDPESDRFEMPTEPFSWNVVINGAWNTAILSPDGIRRRLFQLPDNTLMTVEVAIDRPGPFRVVNQNIVVCPSSERLEISSRDSTPESLRRACELSRRALETLPETPVSAAGVNVRYRLSEVPDTLIDLLRAPLDTTLSDAGFRLGSRLTKRTILVAPGVVNLQAVNLVDAGGTIEFNFHLDSTSPEELSGWIARADEFLGVAEQIATLLGVTDVRREIHA